MNIDCYFVYEIVEIILVFFNNFEVKIGEFKSLLVVFFKLVWEIVKFFFVELLEDIKWWVNFLQILFQDGVLILIILEIMQRLQIMVEFFCLILSIMVLLGDGNWKFVSVLRSGVVGDVIFSFVFFDVGVDGKEIFVYYCIDIIEVLMMFFDGWVWLIF